MKATQKLQRTITISVLIIFLIPFTGLSQPKRIKPPKRISKVKSADIFVNKSFELYEKVFVFDSLTQAGVDIPAELEDELAAGAKEDFDKLVEVTPDVIDDISNASLFRKAKAALNMKKAKNALTFCGSTIKNYFLGTEDED